MRYFVNRLASRMRDLRQTTLRELLDDLRGSGEPANRETVIGSFCALLELIKIGVVRVRQGEGESDISIDLSDEVDSDVEDLVRASRFDDEDLEKDTQAAPESSTPEQPVENPADRQAPQPDLN